MHLLAAGLDPLRDDSFLLAGRLAAAGVEHRLDLVPGVVQLLDDVAPQKAIRAGD